MEYLRLKHFLAEGSLLFIKGKYQLRFNADDRFELKISSIQLLQEVREKLTKKVTFNIALNDVNEELITKIEDLFSKHKGIYPVDIQVNDAGDNFSLNFHAQKLSVSLNEEFMQVLTGYPELELKLN